MVFGGEHFADQYNITHMLVGDFTNTGKVELIALAQHQSYYPADIFRLNPNDGTLISEYWHCGLFSQMKRKDVDLDGVEEILLGGEDNHSGLATLVVLDPRFVIGHSPGLPAPSFPLQEGLEKFILLFPRTDLQPFSHAKRNVLKEIKFMGNGIEAHVAEIVGDRWYGLNYEIDSTLKCIGVAETDVFTVFHNKLVAEGKLTKKLDAQYYEDLRRGVQYWDGKKFLNYPTKNSLYTKSLHLP